MAEQSEEEIDLDQDDSSSESDDTTDSKNDDVSDDNTSDERKNTSNWKKMNEAKKELARELKSEREEKVQLQSELAELKDWANSLYEDESQKPFTKKEETILDDKAEKLEQKIFLLENKEAKDHIDEIKSTKAKYNMDFDEAWTFVQAKLPPESKSKKDFETTSRSARTPKDLSKVSDEEALSLSREQQREWRKLKGYGG